MSVARVAVIDDDPAVCRVIQEVLASEGVQVVSTGEADAAVAFVLQPGIDAAFIDLRLPKRSGLALVEDLRRRGCQTPVIFMTGHASFDSAVEALRLGAIDYLVKPLTAKDIARALSRAAAAGRRTKTVRPAPAAELPTRPTPCRALEEAHAFGCHDTEVLPFLNAANSDRGACDAPIIEVRVEGDLRAIERQIIREVIRTCDGNKAAAARRLGLHRKTLYRLLQADEPVATSC